VTDLTSYGGVVIGSAIRGSKWLPEATEFLEANREILSKTRVAYFLTCLIMSRPTDENRRKACAFLDPLKESVPEVRPVDIGLFAGVLDYSKLPWPMRLLMKRKMKAKGISEGDYRDWHDIRTWAASAHPMLLSGAREEV
jgi:menaquinone-dependent protoporphyrinogen oxidase